MIEGKNPIGGKSQIKLRNVKDFLSSSEKSTLQILLKDTSTKVGELLKKVCHGEVDQAIDLEYEFSISDIIGKNIQSKAAIEELFLPIYIAKDMRSMDGQEALSLAEKYLRGVSTVVFSTLMRQSTQYGDFRIRERILSFMENRTQGQLQNVGNAQFQAQFRKFQNEISVINSQIPGKITHEEAAHRIMSIKGVRNNYINTKAILNQTKMNLWVCFQLLEAMRNDISYRYDRMDFQVILDWYAKQIISLSESHKQRFLYTIRNPKFYKRLINDFSPQYPWLLKSNTEVTTKQDMPESRKAQGYSSKSGIIVNTSSGGISAELLRIARVNASNPHFQGSGGGKSPKKARKIGHN